MKREGQKNIKLIIFLLWITLTETLSLSVYLGRDIHITPKSIDISAHVVKQEE